MTERKHEGVPGSGSQAKGISQGVRQKGMHSAGQAGVNEAVIVKRGFTGVARRCLFAPGRTLESPAVQGSDVPRDQGKWFGRAGPGHRHSEQLPDGPTSRAEGWCPGM